MLSVTLDTNVYISALNYDGNPRRILNLARNGKIRLDISDEILDETTRVLREEKWAWSEDRLDILKKHLHGFANHVTPTEKLTVVKDDPDDDKIVECAAAADSDYLVTGDKGLLKVGSYGKTQIVTPAEFLGIMTGRGRSR